MQIKPVGTASAVLLLTGIGAVSKAAPSFHSPLAKAIKAVQEDADEAQKPYQWALPSIIQAGLIQKEGSAFFSDTYAGFQGRTFNMEQGQVSYGVSDRLQLFYGEQYFLAKGRASTSRLDVADNYYGIRGVVKPPTAADPTSISLQFQAIRPDTASVRTGNTEANFDGTHNNVFSVNYLDRSQDQLRIQYTNISAPGSLSANVYSLGFGHDYQLGDFFKSRVQAELISESYQGSGISSNYELRPLLTGDLAIAIAPWLNLEGDLTVLPAGMPLAGGEFTGLSSFDLYNPGGIVDDLRSDFVAFASIRLLFHGKF